jgi:probable HAF family extracellular repeat protein
MPRLAPVLLLAVAAATLPPGTPAARAAATYTFADAGPTPWIGTSSPTSYILSHARRPTLDEAGRVTFGPGTELIDRTTSRLPVSAITAPYTPQYGGLFGEVPHTAARVGYVAGPHSMAPWQAAYWDGATGTGRTLGGVLPAGAFSIATDTNRAGQVVGYGGSSGAGTSRPAAWTADGSAWDPFAGVSAADLGPSAGAYGLNDAGDIVGRFHSQSNYAVDDRPHAFLLSEGRLADLNDLVALEAGWLLESATDINDVGQITGIARNPSGGFRAFLLTPGAPGAPPQPQPVPEPATLVVLAAGVGLAAARRRARR